MTTFDESGQGEVRTRCYGCNKNDFFPEESFQSWGNYGRALRDTKSRLRNRLMARSSDELELHEMCARSQNEMTRTLNWFDIIWFGVGSVLEAGVFVLTGQAAREHAGPAVIISYLISGLSALLSVLCYTEFSVELPVDGGSFAYLRVELGDFVAFLAAGNILFEYTVAGASIAPKGFNQLDPIAVILSFAICFAGMTKADSSNFQPFAPFGIDGILRASAMLFFAYVGFDGVSTLGEEIKNPGRDIPIGLIGSMVIIIIIYCLVGATLCLMHPYTKIDVDAPFTMAFQAVGMNWAKMVVAIGALKGMTTAVLSNIIGLSLVWVFSKNIVGYLVFVNLWFIATLGLKLTVKEAKKPKWGVPLMPWLPSASVAINIFIMSSVDRPSFIRFSIWTAGLLVYYLFVGLHASYDAAIGSRN
ncbi:Cationic amino acid transporter 1 [Heracleum sosnowskyi]|uniref:Cationic amino acid transporter 1 n=1 Tax=Heracleum sosnowskyi TaxID=360622 RepID=A0AAD8MCX9_9APIA|nr:Cationic amino acid transporter 1 [Heracleum sosnowskyi]